MASHFRRRRRLQPLQRDGGHDSYFEGLTIRNTDLAFQGGLKSIAGSSGLTIRSAASKTSAEQSTPTGRIEELHIADNVMVGRFNPNYLMGFTGRTWQNLPGLSSWCPNTRSRSTARTRRRLQRHLELPRRRGRGDRQSGRQPQPDSRPTARVDRLLRQRHLNVEDNCIRSRRAAPTTSAFSGTAASITATARSACSRCSAVGVSLIRNLVYPRARKRRGQVHRVFLGHRRLPQHAHRAVKPMLLAASNVHYRNNLILGKATRSKPSPSKPAPTLLLGLQRVPPQRVRSFRSNGARRLPMRANFPGEPGKLPFQQQVQFEAQARAAAVQDVEGSAPPPGRISTASSWTGTCS